MADYEGKRTLYEVSGEAVDRARKECPKCGPGVFLADHGDRVACGRCGYTEFTGGKTKSTAQPKAEPAEEGDEAGGAEDSGAEPEAADEEAGDTEDAEGSGDEDEQESG